VRGTRCAWVLLLAASALSGCVRWQPVASYTLVTTDRSALRLEILKENVSGWSCKISTVLDPLARFPWRKHEPPIPNEAFAVEMAIRSVPGAELLVDTTRTRKNESYVLWTKMCATVTGSAARLSP
jgi:hypothetical protein